MNLDEIKELINTMENFKVKKLSLKKGDDFEISLEFREGKKEKESAVEVIEKKVKQQTKEKIEDCNFVASPMVGVFYRAPAPGEKTYVEKGDIVTKDTVVCIVEAMKVMNEVKAGFDGVVEDVFIENAHPVEYGTNLFKLSK